MSGRRRESWRPSDSDEERESASPRRARSPSSAIVTLVNESGAELTSADLADSLPSRYEPPAARDDRLLLDLPGTPAASGDENSDREDSPLRSPSPASSRGGSPRSSHYLGETRMH